MLKLNKFLMLNRKLTIILVNLAHLVGVQGKTITGIIIYLYVGNAHFNGEKEEIISKISRDNKEKVILIEKVRILFYQMTMMKVRIILIKVLGMSMVYVEIKPLEGVVFALHADVLEPTIIAMETSIFVVNAKKDGHLEV
jgi:hypothetical protein